MNKSAARTAHADKKAFSPRALPDPFIWQVELTNHCPYHCLGCPRKDMQRAHGFMEFGTFQECIRAVQDNPSQVRPLGLHHFGESLLHPDLAGFTAYAGQRGVPTWLSCNPELLTPQAARALLTAGLTRITFSLDGLDDGILTKIRGTPASYKQSEEAILDFLDQHQQMGSTCEVRVQMVAYKMNQHQWDSFLEKWQVGPAYAYIKKFDCWTEPRLAPLGADPMRHACTAPFESVVVLWDGRVVPCCHDLEGELAMGHISDGLSSIWSGIAYQNLREQFLAHTLPPDHLCRRCAWRQ